MHWIQLIFNTTQQECPYYSEILTNIGALSVTLEDAGDQPIYEPLPGETPHWSDTKVVGLFESGADIKNLIAQIENQIKPKIIAPWEITKLEDRDWTKEWTKDFHPIQVSKELWICPSWCEAPEPNATNVYMDPGLAFGSGTHATTYLCMDWLARQQLSGLDIVDFGCGSGILAITAAKLGAKQIWAIDNDPQALIATRDNAINNTVLDVINIGLPNTSNNLMVDVLIANILALPLVELAKHFANLVKPHGKIILSGILPDQIDLITKNYVQWFDVKPATIKDNWVRIEGSRRNIGTSSPQQSIK